MSKEFESKVLDFIDVATQKFDKIDERFDKIDKRLDNVENTLNEHTKMLDDHNGKINSLQKSIDLIENKVIVEFPEMFKNLSESVTLIEHKVTTELPALFEAFELHQEMHKDYDEKNSYLSSKVEENSMRISILEDQMKFVKTN